MDPTGVWLDETVVCLLREHFLRRKMDETARKQWWLAALRSVCVFGSSWPVEGPRRCSETASLQALVGRLRVEGTLYASVSTPGALLMVYHVKIKAVCSCLRGVSTT